MSKAIDGAAASSSAIVAQLRVGGDVFVIHVRTGSVVAGGRRFGRPTGTTRLAGSTQGYTRPGKRLVATALLRFCCGRLR